MYLRTICALLLLLFIKSCSEKETSENDLIYNDQEIRALESLKTDTTSNAKNIVTNNGEKLDLYLKRVDPAFYSKYLSEQPTEMASNEKNLEAINGCSDNLKLDVDQFEALKRIQSYLMGASLFLCKKENHVFKDVVPKQIGIGYGYGLGQYQKKEKPKLSICTDLIHGLDCAGFVKSSFCIAGLEYSGLAASLAQPNSLETSLRAIKSLNNVKVIAIEGKPDAKFFKSGDVIYWYRENTDSVNHIGFISRLGNGAISVFQSNGRINDCKINLTKGPRAVYTANVDWFGSKWGILRILPPLNGTWVLQDNRGVIEEIEFKADDKWTYSHRKDKYHTDELKYDEKSGLVTFTRTLHCNNGIQATATCKGDLSTGSSGLMPVSLKVGDSGCYFPPEINRYTLMFKHNK